MSQGLSQNDPGIYVQGTVVINPDPDTPTDPPVATGTFNPPNGSIGSSYNYDAAVLFTGGVVVSYSLTGTLPDGLTFNTSTGVIAGVPTTEETLSNISVTATNSFGSDTTNAAAITINAAPAPGDYSLAEITVESHGDPLGTVYPRDSNPSSDYNQKTIITAAQSKITVDNTHVVSGAQSYKMDVKQNDVFVGFRRQVPNGVTLLSKDFYQYQFKTYFPIGFNFTANVSSLKWQGFDTYPQGTARLWIKLKNSRLFEVEDEGWSGTGYDMDDHVAGPHVDYDVWQTWTAQINCSVTPGVARLQFWGAGGILGASSVLLTDSWLDQPSKTAGLTKSPGGSGTKSAQWRHIDNWNKNPNWPGSGSPRPAQDQDYWCDDIYMTDSDNPLAFTAGVPDVI